MTSFHAAVARLIPFVPASTEMYSDVPKTKCSDVNFHTTSNVHESESNPFPPYNTNDDRSLHDYDNDYTDNDTEPTSDTMNGDIRQTAGPTSLRAVASAVLPPRKKSDICPPNRGDYSFS